MFPSGIARGRNKRERYRAVANDLAVMKTGEYEPVFRATRISKVYHVGEVDVHALRGVDLDLCAGEFMVLLGPSGSGKSTLLNILGGLDVPTSGTVHYLNHELTAFDDTALTRFRREHVGFVFQFYNLIPSLTARENVALITEISRNPLDPREALDLVSALTYTGDPAQQSHHRRQREQPARDALRPRLRRDTAWCEGVQRPHA